MATEKVTYELSLRDLMTKGLADINKNLSAMESKLNKVQTTANKSGKSMAGFGSSLKSSFMALGAVGATLGIGALGKEIFDTTAEFQKYDAVLKSTFGGGSSGAEMAKSSMDMIKEFAATTPFGINELTGAFVKLANRGIVPTSQEFTALGDLASSTGKSMDMLAEALLDAQMNEWERLKEFGIKGKVKKGTDQVTLSFKNLSKTVRNTPEDIKNALIEFGKMDSVKGMMANVSKTLGGQASNLSDKFDMLKLKLGNIFAGEMGGGLQFLSGLIDKFSYAIDWAKTNASQLFEIFKPLGELFAPIWGYVKEIATQLGFASYQGNLLNDAFNLMGSILKFLQPVFKVIGEIAGALFKLISAIAIGIWGILKPILGFLNNLLPEKFKFKMIDFGFKEPAKEDNSKKIAEYDKLATQLNLQKDKGASGGSAGGSDKMKSEIDTISGKAPSNMYINIDALIKDVTMYPYEMGKTGANDLNNFLTQLENALITVVSDVNRIKN
jgi:hypothetical protein